MRASLFLLLIAATGCDNVDTTPATHATPPPGGTATPSPTGSGTPLPEETPSLSEGIGGLFVVTRQRSNEPESDMFATSGFFVSTAWPIETAGLAAQADQFPQIPTDSCGAIPASTIGGGAPSDLGWLDAGDLALHGPGGADPLTKLDFFGMVTYGAIAPDSHWQPAAAFELTGAGDPGGVGAFTAELVSPHEVEVLTPGDLLSVSPRPVPRTQDIPLTWETKDDGSPLFVWIQQGTAENDGTVSLARVCKFADDGAGVIPASVLDDFDASLDGAVDDGLYIQRYRPHVFEAPGAAGPVLLFFESGWWIRARYE